MKTSLMASFSLSSVKSRETFVSQRPAFLAPYFWGLGSIFGTLSEQAKKAQKQMLQTLFRLLS